MNTETYLLVVIVLLVVSLIVALFAMSWHYVKGSGVAVSFIMFLFFMAVGTLVSIFWIIAAPSLILVLIFMFVIRRFSK